MRQDLLPVIIPWIALVALTLLSVDWLSAQRFASIAIVVVAGLKAALIASEYMELRAAPRSLRFGFGAWLLVLCTALAVLL